MKVSYNWLKDYLGEQAPTPAEIEQLLTFHAFEVESVEVKGADTVIDVKILPDRASDCLCHRGIAHEIAAITNVPLVHDPFSTEPTLPSTEAISVAIADTESCPRFTASIVNGITVGESPAWLKERLAALGQRSINNIVDATNYVMYAIGQPLHAYDADKFPKVDGKWQFAVRGAALGETVSLLAEGGKDEDRIVTLKGGELLIVDASSGTPIGLAGVKGGRFAGVDSTTKNIIIEAAHFHPARTRKTARGLGIVIDASKRFENEPSRNLPPYAQAEIIKLITDIAGGTCEGYLDVYPTPKHNPAVVVSLQTVNALLGLALCVDEVAAILTRVGVAVTTHDNNTLTCVGPFERTDLLIEENFIDEVGRIFGYQHVASVVPATVPLAEVNARQYYSDIVRTALMQRGFSEVITSSFVMKADVRLLSSLASDKTCMRDALTPNLDAALTTNAPFVDLLGATDTRIFEIGTVFTQTETGVTEHVALGIGMRLKQTGYSGKEDALLTAIMGAVEEALGVTITWSVANGVAECNVTELLTKLPAPEGYRAVEPSAETVYKPFSMYPAVVRDIAMWVPEGTEAGAVATILNDAAGALRVRTTHVDSFTKDGRTSLAFRLVFQAADRTLTDDEVNVEMENVYQAATVEGFETR